MPEDTTPLAQGKPEPSILGELSPDELFARGMQSVKITGAGGLGTWEAPTLEEAARLFPNYEVLEIIGRGGMGAVYKARQVSLERMVAIKLLPLEVSADRDFAERFKREARTMARLNHPNIVSVFDFGTTQEGHLYFVMEFVEGTTLHHLIKTMGLKAPHALEIIMGVCEALNYAHAEGIVHRDIKPANVLVDVRGRVKVTDFGLARLSGPTAAEQAGYTMTGTVLGTPDYMAPEQKRGLHVDHRADIYSLGVMLYEMLCGQVPQGVFDLPSQLVSVDERVDQVVIRAMHQEPDRRYQNTAEMKHEVQTIRMVKNPNAKAPRPRTRKRNPLLIAGAVVGVAMLASVWYVRQREPDESSVPEPRYAPAGAQDPANNSTAVTAATPPVSPAPAPEPPATTTPPGETAIAATPPPPAGETAALSTTQPPEPAPTPSVPAPPADVATAAVPTPAPPPPDSETTQPIPNPAMASSVAQLGPNPNPSNETNSPPAPELQDWERYAQRAEALMRRRDPEGAIQAFEQALAAGETSPEEVPAVELARICLKMGGLEAALGSTAEARGSYEYGRRLLIESRGSGKLSPEAARVLSEIEGTIRRLPRDE